MLDILVSNTSNSRNIDAAAQLLLQPRLWVPGGDYPAHAEWVDMAVAHIENGQKRAMVAYSGSNQVGVLVYQRHKTNQEKLELKNLSVVRSARGRRIADFLLRQVEVEAPLEYPGVREMVSDAKSTNHAMIAFAMHNGMTVVARPQLDNNFGHNGVTDVLFTKSLVYSSHA